MSKISVQCDWNRTISEGDGRFWLSIKPSEENKSVYTSVEVRKEHSTVGLVPDDSRFQLRLNNNQNSLEVKFVSVSGDITTSTFYAASSSFSLADASNKKITVLDVTDGGLGLSACQNSTTVSIWETRSGVVRRRLVDKHAGDVYVAKFFPSGIVVATAGADTRILIWSAETGECAATITGHKAGVEDLDFIDKGRNIVSCAKDGTSKLWDVSKQACISTFPGEDQVCESVNCISVTQASCNVDLVSPSCSEGESGTEGKLLLTGLESGLIKGYSLQSKSQILAVDPCEGAVDCMCMISAETLVVGTANSTICVYDIRSTGEPLFKSLTGRSGINSISKYKQGYIYTCGDGSTVVMDETLTSPIYELTGPDCDPVYIAKSTAGGTVYASCRDGFIRMYNL